MPTNFLWIGALAILLLLDLWALNSVWRSSRSSANKALWTAMIVLLPLVGLVIWGAAGPRGVTKGPSSPEHSKG
ncbi:PLD nuclease N-terminal domain-containing protein [Pseudomonas vanderleydeniana]|uniref:PLD nuclease N-terminal domain-containing protein n=1 Tax=Pseudomonas vanderleydeniana TaxID=2745495 RepID=A0A9E6PHR4_9PSED|nr:PLD nuclease N-terminal domain-containing protein [Pseudomonas vanderleydeniana]QXI26318.1 PLD nuclease N-terminal domain-containing protein [Pseudomonas vanderleydeniana]